MTLQGRTLIVIGTLLALASAAAAQGNVHWVNPGLGGTGFSYQARVAPAGYVDGDNVPDVIVGYEGNSYPTRVVHVMSGLDGSLIWSFSGPLQSGFGLAVSGLGDVNADGFGEVIIGAPGLALSGPYLSGYVDVYSGATGLLLYSIPGAPGHDFGYSVAPAGYVNGDASPDFLVGAPSWGGGSGYVRTHSGLNGSLILNTPGMQVPSCNSGLFGYSVASAGDVDGDSVPDHVVGNFLGCSGSGMIPGVVTLHSGADGSMLFPPLTGQGLGGSLGSVVAGVGDVDGDGVPDVAATHAAPPPISLDGAVVISGASGSVVQTLDPGVPSGTVSGLGDVDGDGIPDIAVGWSATVFSPGASWANLGSYGPPQAYASVAGIGDVNGDGIPDMAVGERGGTRVWVILMGTGYQQNFAAAILQLNGLQGSANIPAGLTLPANTTATLTLSSTGTNMPWELGFGIRPLVPQGAGALTTVGGQILNLDLADPTFTPLWNYFQSPGFTNTTIPFSVPNAASLSTQMLVVAPGMPSGLAISQPTRLVVQ